MRTFCRSFLGGFLGTGIGIFLSLVLITLYFFFLAPHVEPTKEDCDQVLSVKDLDQQAVAMASLVPKYQDNGQLPWYGLLICPKEN